MAYPKMYFIAQRDNDEGDDLIMITKNSTPTNTYSIELNDESSESFPKRSIRTTDNGVIEYVRNLLLMLSEDSNPFPYLQVMLPGYPSTIYTSKQLKDKNVRHHILEWTKNTMMSWPVYSDQPRPQIVTQRHHYNTRSSSQMLSRMGV